MVTKTPTGVNFGPKRRGGGIKTVTKKCPSDRPEGRVVVFVVTKLACPPLKTVPSTPAHVAPANTAVSDSVM